MFTSYLDFQGRLGRKEYFINFLKYIGVAFVFSFVAVLSVLLTAKYVSQFLGFALGAVAFVVYFYGVIRFSLSQGAKRAHDLGMSGWACLLLIVPVLSFFAMLYFFFARGQAQDNEYGPGVKG